VPNGSYNVVLKFAEIYWTTTGQRLFNVSINGTQVLTNFDIVAAAGAPLTAIDKTFPVTTTTNQVTVQFTTGAANLPKVSAIEIH
ncbi:MAG: malectin domain-containing carbohydrate-binding protein, partial [Candidatus Acidiferrales bacterium]